MLSLRKLIDDNGFTDTDDIETVQKDYELNSSTVVSFVDQLCEITKDEDDIIICRDLYDEYTKYCKTNNSGGMTAIKDNVFGSEVALLHIKKGRRRLNGYQVYVYVGIKLKKVLN